MPILNGISGLAYRAEGMEGKSEISSGEDNGKTIRDSYNLLNNIINFLPYPTFIIDHDGVVLFWNKAMEEMTNVKANQIIGKGNYEYSIAFYGERRPILIDLVSKEQEELTENYPLIKRDHENDRLFGESPYIPHIKCYLDGCASILRNESGEALGAIEVVRDITEEKNIQQELIRAREEALSAARVKSEFLANMSHEIRTPMNAIIGLSHLMTKTELNGKQLDYMNKIRDSAQHLLGIINDILDFSKIEAGKFTIEETDFNLEEVLDHVSNIVGHAAHKKGLELLFNVQEGIPVLLRGDPLRLGQVLINLANNAVKFTESGHVLISVELRSGRKKKPAEAGYFKFSVEDTGIGITKEQKTRLFQSFSQADASVTRKYGGTGLGLAISKKFVELMGGSLECRSRHRKGSTFFFTLPFSIRQEQKGIDHKKILGLRGSKALIVDDQDVSLEVLSSYMESMDFRVTVARSGYEALGILENSDGGPFEIIIMDWNMPGLDGIETIARMRNGGLISSSSVVIMVSAYSADDVKDRAGSLGIGEYLTKPVTQSRLFDAIINICGQKPETQTGFGKDITSAGEKNLFGPHKVLLVEDNSINQQVATELMESAGLKVDVASNGKEAVEMIGAKEYACVLMDIQMPVMDGFESTKMIRATGRHEGLPIIAMTAHAMAGDRERCIEAGMNDHTPKPIDPERFFKTLRRWIGQDNPLRPSPKKPAPDNMAVKNMGDPELPDTLPGLDVNATLKLVAGNKRLLGNILREFAASFGNAFMEIPALMEENRTPEALRLIHNIKGTSGNIGAFGLQRAATALEKSLKQNDTGKNISGLLKAVENELALVVATSKTFQAKRSPAEKGAGAPGKAMSKEKAEDLKNSLGLLLEKVRQNSFDALEFFERNFLPDESKKPYLRSWSEELKAAQRALNSFDFDGASAPLQAILGKLEAFINFKGANGKNSDRG